MKRRDTARQHSRRTRHAVTAAYGGTAGAAASDGATSRTAGELPVGSAWATIQVPISLAALRMDPSLTPVMTRAISDSDNDAADRLWTTPGTPGQAGAGIPAVLTEGNAPPP